MKTKETNPTRPGSPTPRKQALNLSNKCWHGGASIVKWLGSKADLDAGTSHIQEKLVVLQLQFKKSISWKAQGQLLSQVKSSTS